MWQRSFAPRRPLGRGRFIWLPSVRLTRRPRKVRCGRVPARFFGDLDESLQLLRAGDYCVFRMLADGGDALQTVRLPRRCAFVLGHEEFGLSAAASGLPALRIAQYGPVQSLNVSVAASIAMYEYFRQHPLEI